MTYVRKWKVEVKQRKNSYGEHCVLIWVKNNKLSF
jgi:hypothetical protein